MTSPVDVVEATRNQLGRIGVWLFGLQTPLDVLGEQVVRLDRLGYGSVWIGEGVGGKEAFAKSAVLLAATSRIVVGTGIANVNSRHGATMQAGGATLADAYPGRFVLGVGIGHAFQAEQVGKQWRPLEHLREHFEQMDTEAATNPPPVPFPRIVASLGPKMLELTRERADGTHPFMSPVAHTAFAREVLGPDKLVIPQQAVVLESDAGRAREIARNAVGMAITMPRSPYFKNMLRFGYTADDLGQARDNVIDALVACGDEGAIANRVQAQLAAGADHVLVSPATENSSVAEAVDQLERLAPALLS
ncbi:LLM class oxidoreductase [Flindersiella endophytica]